ncbi:GCN5 family acetyltransferase [Pseudomonas putida]|uniref:GNAT family N-acetyltransferase n=2 Tax=Pseudomonas TaxID=286 RepID=UPI000730828E|nr:MULTISPECIES: GNAT family N-acetyltransferase [Pseudomonas]KTC18754.1 GCN5 family acetyltransferase [Pseudomonas putida]WKL67083.1 GNAT family N-acetyltransferase [Pseudomonas qingdaonensis]
MQSFIRPATTADIEALFEIRTSVVQNHLSREQMLALGITPASLAEAIAAAPCAWLAEVEGMPAAFAMVDLEDACVFALFVKPAFEGQGLARQLMVEAEAALFALHSRIWLETDGRDGVRANGFYRRLGWEVVAQLEEGDVRYEKVRQAPA